MDSIHFIPNLHKQKVKSAPLHLPPPPYCVTQNGESIQFFRGFALPCSQWSVCAQWEQCAHARKLDPVPMTVVRGKQYVYRQHWSMVCTLWLALPQQSSGRQLRDLIWPLGSDSQVDYCLAFPRLSIPLNLSFWSGGKHSWAPSQLLFCDTLST